MPPGKKTTRHAMQTQDRQSNQMAALLIQRQIRIAAATQRSPHEITRDNRAEGAMDNKEETWDKGGYGKKMAMADDCGGKEEASGGVFTLVQNIQNSTDVAPRGGTVVPVSQHLSMRQKPPTPSCPSVTVMTLARPETEELP